jgi:hypothetical protein
MINNENDKKAKSDMKLAIQAGKQEDSQSPRNNYQEVPTPTIKAMQNIQNLVQNS